MLYRVFNSIANRIWKNYSLENVRTTANDFITFRFKMENELQMVLENGLQMFGGKALFFSNDTFIMSSTRSQFGFTFKVCHSHYDPERG